MIYWDNVNLSKNAKVDFEKHSWKIVHYLSGPNPFSRSTYIYTCDTCEFSFNCCNMDSNEMFYHYLPSVMVSCGEYLMDQILR